MTHAEQLKWKNKLRLWRVLHPDYGNGYCCQYYCKIQEICFSIKCRLREHIDTKEINEFLGEDAQNCPDDWRCVEWIRKI